MPKTISTISLVYSVTIVTPFIQYTTIITHNLHLSSFLTIRDYSGALAQGHVGEARHPRLTVLHNEPHIVCMLGIPVLRTCMLVYESLLYGQETMLPIRFHRCLRVIDYNESLDRDSICAHRY